MGITSFLCLRGSHPGWASRGAVGWAGATLQRMSPGGENFVGHCECRGTRGKPPWESVGRFPSGD